MMNKKNRGFSLVELIVVVAIMAVLVGVLAPSLLRYVEKTRIQKDATAVSEVVEAVKVAMADEEINKDTATGVTITIDTAGAFTQSAGTKLLAEVQKIVGTSLSYSSTAAESVTITVTKDTTNGTVAVAVTAPASTATTDWGKAVAKVK